MSWEIPEEPEKVEINKNADIGNYRVLLGTRFCPWRRRGEKVKEDVLAAVESTLKVERTGNRRRKTNVLRNTFGGLAPNTIENKKGSKTLPLNIHTATKVLDEDTTKTATTKGKYTGKYREEQSDQTQLNKKLYPPHPNSPANVDNHALNNIVCDPAKNSGIVPVSFNTEIQNESSRGSARLALEWKNMNVDIFLPKDGECKKGNEHENESEGLCLNKCNSSDKSSKYRKDQRRNTLKPKARIFSFPRYEANNRSVPGVAFNLEYLRSIKRGFGKHRERHSNNSVQTFTTAKEMYTSSSVSSSETSGATSSGDGTNAEYSESDNVISDSEDSYWDVVTSEDASLGTDEFKQKPDNSELFDKKSRKEYIKDSQVTAEHKDSQSVSDLDTDVAEIKSRQNKGGGLAGADTIQTGEGVGGFVTEFKKNEDPRVGNSSLLHTSNIEERNVASNRDSQGVHGEQACEAGNKDSDDRKLDQNKGSADKNQNRLFSAILKKVLEKNRKKKVDERKRVADPKVAQNTPFGTDMEFRGDVIWLSSRAATRLIRIDKGIFERGIVPTNWNGSRGGLGAYRWTESWIALTQRGIFVFTDIIGIPDLQILFPPASKLSPKLMGHSNSDGIIGISFGYKPATKFKQNTGKTWDGPVGMFYRHTDECEKEESKPQIEASRYYMLLIKFPNLKASKVWCRELEKWINACLREYRESVIGKTTHVEFSPPSKLNVGVPLLGVNISVSTLRGALRGRGKVMLELQEEYDNNPKQNSCKNSANNTGSSQSTKRFIDDKRTGVFLRRFVSVWDIRDLVLETLVNIPRYSDTKWGGGARTD
ncbi:hypothetical protein AX774_g283 [Zancudomyces culisetae]|uniref:Uncharacterized protein n=1 Tax=Zancudomyces culisetae TaxID=1213189 RepID=A0A1R1PZ05_ZANCU|nr:hypothetical protein AX774_g283 [Zancudomyces culisetae]|eukprot:OMH86169.1 hypothetical protein AX774_g283 [Zancudomyces culisetae]